MTMLEAIEKHGGPSQADRDPEKARAALEGSGLKTSIMDEGQLVVALFEHFAEEKLIQPTFIYDFPASVSPLSRKLPATHGSWIASSCLWAGKNWQTLLANSMTLLTKKNVLKLSWRPVRVAMRKRIKWMKIMFARLGMDCRRPVALGFGVDRLVVLLTGCSIHSGRRVVSANANR